MASPNKPNVVIPLATSYNERGIDGFATTITNAKDQRKINSIYEPVKNSMTGKTTLYLAKRPGVNVESGSHGTSGQVAYLCSIRPNASALANFAAGDHVIFTTNGGNAYCNTAAASNLIVAGYTPQYVDITLISGVRTMVVQLGSIGVNGPTYYSTDCATWTQITDTNFSVSLYLVGKMEHMDGYAFISTADNSRIYNSDLNTITAWGVNSFITKQIVQDYSIGLARLGKMIISFGTETMEVFQNVGNATGSPLATVPSLFQKVGKIIPFVSQTTYYATLRNRIYWPGHSGQYGNFTSIFTFNGQTVEKVSTVAIDKILAGNNGMVYSVSTMSINGQEAIAFALDIQSATTQRWLMFFPEWNDWFEWHSTVFMPVNSGKYYLGVGTNQHKVYSYFNSNGTNLVAQWLDDATAYTMTHQFALPSDGDYRKFMSMAGVMGDTETAASTLNVSFSDDDYATFSTARGIDMTSNNGKLLYRCGSYRKRAVRLTHSGNIGCRLTNFVARVE